MQRSHSVRRVQFESGKVVKIPADQIEVGEPQTDLSFQQ